MYLWRIFLALPVMNGPLPAEPKFRENNKVGKQLSFFFLDSVIFFEVLVIFPLLSYQLTFIMLNVGMVDNLEFW